MKIAISIDSACDIPQELIKKYNLRVIPYYIILGDKECVDGVDVSVPELFQFVKDTGTLPKTAAISSDKFRTHFLNLLKDYDEVIHFSLSSKMSSSCLNATAGADGLNVYVVDSKSLSSGIALLVLKCAQMVENGDLTAAEIVENIKNSTHLVQASFLVDTLTFLHKGGRCSAVALVGSKLLKIKPKILVKDGKMDVAKKYMGNINNCLIKYVDDTLNGNNPDKTIAFCTHSSKMEISEQICQRLREYGFKEVYDVDAGSTISSHCGPGTLGILFMNKE
ncbi:MAG: DegV family protein, partial [Clostridia bacterium]|nr:DegV family protein [Clostridia bacterium]